MRNEEVERECGRVEAYLNKVISKHKNQKILDLTQVTIS
jgi:hypothetical protein